MPHAEYAEGQACPHCGDGILYRQNQCAMIVRLVAQPPVGGTVYALERLRCGLCGKCETAELPPEAGPKKYDPSVSSMVGVLRYGQGMPWNRIHRIQQSAGVPLPASVQWELIRDALPFGLEAVYRQLLEDAAQGDLMHNDDTHMCIVDLTAKRQEGRPLRDDQPERRGVFTTSILSLADHRPMIALFFTGPRHAGENLRELLTRRLAERPPPLQMCDALSRNLPRDLKTIVAHCMSHARRNFHELVDLFPSETLHVLERLATVYEIDATAKRQALSPDDRLRLHQEHSRPVMDDLHRWLRARLDERHVEPNSSLGGAIQYMLNHWSKLMLFLELPGAPLDNNVCERALKMSIRHRKNSLFYRTTRGAEVGDIYMSLIHTCYSAKADPFHYLTQLQRHHLEVIESPSTWLPWTCGRQSAAA